MVGIKTTGEQISILCHNGTIFDKPREKLVWMECTNLVDPHQLLCHWFTVVFVLFCIYIPDNQFPRPIVKQGGGLFWTSVYFSEIREIDNNKKFSSTPPFCCLPCVYF
jgi:hypothetical protein